MRFGGLDGDGIICNNAPGAIGTTVYFQAQQGKTFTGGDFTGTFSKWFISSESNIKIVMDSGSGGTQTPKLIRQSETAADRCDFEEASGRLALNAAQDVGIASLNLANGEFKVAGATAGAKNGEITWNADAAIYMDLFGNNAENDMIKSDTCVLAGEGHAIEFEYDNTNIEAVYENFRIADGTSVEGKTVHAYTSDMPYEGAFTFQDGVLSGMFAQVPEASEIALIFGAIALCFAAYRRGK